MNKTVGVVMIILGVVLLIGAFSTYSELNSGMSQFGAMLGGRSYQEEIAGQKIRMYISFTIGLVLVSFGIKRFFVKVKDKMDHYADIERLSRLNKDGHISDEEFAAEKSKIMNQIK